MSAPRSRPWGIEYRDKDGVFHYHGSYKTRDSAVRRLAVELVPGGDFYFGARLLYEGRIFAVWGGRFDGSTFPWAKRAAN
jgi:hypothetical protein